MEFAPKETDDGESDVEFVSDIKGGSVPKEYIPGVQKGIESVLGNGVVAGFPVLGIKVRASVRDEVTWLLTFEMTAVSGHSYGRSLP